MAAETLGSLILWLIVVAIVIVIAVYLLRWLYRRSTKETAFVRTGFGGEKVVVSGGAFVVPVLHDITPVNMNVMRIEVERRRDAGADHQEPHARRHRRGILRQGWIVARGGQLRRADAGPPRRCSPKARATCWKAASLRRCAPWPRR